jgi:imidazole glycerol phosphate synthase glutamine amidotransferase subunit
VIGILDYGAGNLRSVQNTLEEIGASYELIRSPERVRAADAIVLPGVGHFGQMMAALDDMQVRQPLLERLHGGTPFLGICLGLQALFSGSEEAPGHAGLGVFGQHVRRFAGHVRIPHMGWNSLQANGGSRLLAHIEGKPYVYFAHSYYAPVVGATAATCTYTVRYTAVLESGNLFGVQFHPEKSGPLGIQIVRNFLDVCG